MFGKDASTFTETGRNLFIITTTFERLSVRLLSIDMVGRLDLTDKGMFRGIYKVVSAYKFGIVLLLIDCASISDRASENVIRSLARKAIKNLNNLHMVVGTGPGRTRAHQLGFDNIACLHDSYASFMAEVLC
jgi:hypothetical protein